MEKIIRLPNASTWQLTLVLMALLFVGLAASAIGAVQNSNVLFFTGTVCKLLNKFNLKVTNSYH